MRQKNHRKGMTSFFKGLGWTVLVIFLIFLIFLAYGNINNRWYKLIYVKSDSMSPTIKAGDLICITKPPYNIEPGMIISFEIEDQIVTHRVFSVEEDGEIKTKGDANDLIDDWGDYEIKNVGGIYRFRIPYIGYPIGFINGWLNNKALPAINIFFRQKVPSFIDNTIERFQIRGTNAFFTNQDELIVSIDMSDTFEKDTEKTETLEEVSEDTTPPTITGLTDDETPVQSKTWNWDADEEATFRFAIDQDISGVPSGEYSDVKTATQADGDGVYYIHVQAKDSSGNESEVVTVSSTLDNTPPLISSFYIDDGSETTINRDTVLTIAASDDNGLELRLKNDGSDWTSWQALTDTLNWQLTDGFGSKTVNIEIRDEAGNTSDSLDSIDYIEEVSEDTTPPTITGLTDDETPVQSKTWNWDADEEATFRFAIDQDISGVPSGEYSDVKTATQADGDGVYYIHVQAKDSSGNESEVVTVSAVLDNSQE